MIELTKYPGYRAKDIIRNILLFILFLCCPLFILAQSKITGKVIDGVTKAAVSGATVYIDQTQLTSVTDDRGYFLLNNVPPKGVIVITHISYEKGKKEIEKVRDTVLIELFSRDIALDNVVLQSRIKDTWQKWGRQFTNILIGYGLEKECVLLNPQDVRFHYDKSNTVLKAWARKPLLVENKMLGYILHIDFDSLIYSFEKGNLFYVMTEYFEWISSNDENERRMISSNRLLAYRGSRLHFSRALFKKNLEEEGFHLYQYKGNFNQEKSRVEMLLLRTITSYNESNLKEAENSIDLSVFGKDTARYYRNVLKQPTYTFQDSASANFTGRWNRGLQNKVRFYLGSDTMLVAYQEAIGISFPESYLKKWARMREPGSSIKKNYDFFQTGSGKGKFTLMHLLRGENLHIRENGSIENVADLFIEGYMADNRLGYDLPWDYDPENDEQNLEKEQSIFKTGVSSKIENSLLRIASDHTSTELYLHLDKTIYDPGENIWFAAYIIRSAFKPDDHHTLYVFLQNPGTKKNIASEKFVMTSGLGAGYIFLPDSIPPGSYHLIAYTNTLPGEKNPVVFDQAVVIRPFIEPFTLEYSEKSNQYRNDSVFIRCKIRSEFGQNTSATVVKYSLTSGGKHLKSGKTEVNSGGELILPGIPLKDVEGEKIILVTELKQKQEEIIQLRNELSIVGNHIKIRWYPEGGELVDGLASALAYEITDLYNQPLAIRIKLLKNKNFISELNSDGSGSGTIQLIPDSRQEYSVELYNDSLKIVESEFPQILKQGYSIHINHGVVEDSLRFYLRSTQESAGVYVMVHNYKSQFYFDKLLITGKEKEIVLPARLLQEGLATVTLFDGQGRPVAERCVFKEPVLKPELNIELDSSAYHTRSKVIVKLKTTDEAGDPVQAVLSVASVLNSRIDTTRFQDIIPFSYINNYRAAGVIDQKPDYHKYLTGRMERFLLIQCWTRYKWQSLESIVNNRPAPYYSMIQKGYVMRNDSYLKKPVEVIMITAKSLATITTDSSGYFEINTEMMTTEPDWRLTLAVNEKHQGEYKIILQNDNDDLQDNLAMKEYKVPHRVLYIPEEPPASHVKTLAPAFVQSRSVKDEDAARRFLKGIKKDQELCEDYICFRGTLNCIQHISGTKPQVGQTYYLQCCSKTGLINYRICTTKPPPEFTITETRDTIIYKLKGRYYSKQFYMADYEKYNPPATETLTTLYWNPFIQTNENGEATFSFYTNDLKGRMAIVAEGVGGGSVLSGKRIFRVSK